MSQDLTDLTVPSKLKLALLLVLAFGVAISWLGLGYVIGTDPTEFAISSSSDGDAGPNATGTTTPTANVSVDELRESLTRTNFGGKSTVSMTAIWATETYWAASDLSSEAFEVDPAENYVFLVFLDTHTGALPEMDWMNGSRLRVDGESYEPVDGYTRAGGYHHLVAVVQFSKTANGERIVQPATEEVTLEVTGLELNEPEVPDDRPRNVTWAYPPPYYDASPEIFTEEG